MTIYNKGFGGVAIAFFLAASAALFGGISYYLHWNPSPQPVVSNPPTASSTATSSMPYPLPLPPRRAPTSPITQSSSTIEGSLSPSSGFVGTTVTIHGSGFASTGNQVSLNGLVSAGLSNISSSDGKTITFVVPGTLGPNCNMHEACPQFLMFVGVGSYDIRVTSNGATQDFGDFSVTGGGSLRALP